MKRFLEMACVEKLLRLAKEPIDLTLTGSLTPERIAQMRASAEGFDLLYASERVTLDVISALFEMADEANALEKMAAMQSGQVVNRIDGFKSENRTVLHTAMRDQFDHPQMAKEARQASHLAAQELAKLQFFLEKIDKQPFTDLIQIGIGGSDLGPRALYLALMPYARKDRRVHFISNVDPDDANRVLSQVDLKKTLIVVVSKSGTTLETMTNEEFVCRRLKQQGLDPKNHIIAVTKEKSPMDDPSRYLASFYIWDFVGGRFSATSMVGGVSLGFALGFLGFQQILQGAHAMDIHALKPRNLPLLTALLGIWNRNFLLLPTLAVVPYSQALIRFTAHLQQLSMESNGKRIDRLGRFVDYPTGLVVWGEIGTNGQHSFYQLIHQGTDVIPVEFVGFRESQSQNDLELFATTSQEKLLANLFAQSIALSLGQKNANPNQVFPGNRPNHILLGQRLDPYSLGSLLAFYEHQVAFQGFIWNVNSFDQEGVQLGKVLADRILEVYADRRRKRPSSSFPLAQAYLKIIDEKSSN